MRFGIFLAPFHARLGSPTLTYERDIELIQALDRYGYDEAWIGEHHSGGAQTIACPQLFLAVLAERTRHIRLGTGVVSLPYHHPLDVVERMVMLDHITRGRVMLGVGSGALTGDAYMRGLEPAQLRPRMTESLDVIRELLEARGPVSCRTDWFELREAQLQMRPYTQPCFEIAVASLGSTGGAQIAGERGCSLLCMGGAHPDIFNALPSQWHAYAEASNLAGWTPDRRVWRVVAPMHLGRTRQQALEDVEYGLMQYLDYTVASTDRSLVPGARSAREAAQALIDSGVVAIGTPDDAAAFLERLLARSGGFATFLFLEIDWADREATQRSYELFADEVIPAFQGQQQPLHASWSWTADHREEFKYLRSLRSPNPAPVA